jgi:hypothetical protein
MKLYADTSARFTAQLVGDVLFVCWVVAWVWIGNVVHDSTMELAGPGHQITASATGLSDSMKGAGDALGDLPVVGDSASAPFDQAAEASASLAEAGRTEVRAVERLAFWLGLSIALIPILVVALRYLPRRARFVRDAGAAQRFVDGPADLEVFALRAIAHQPLHVLARVSDDPMTALRERDRAVIARLADLELRASGLTPPARAT